MGGEQGRRTEGPEAAAELPGPHRWALPDPPRWRRRRWAADDAAQQTTGGLTPSGRLDAGCQDVGVRAEGTTAGSLADDADDPDADGADGAEPTPAMVDEPARSDGFVRGLSEAIGGPLGEHAVRPPRSEYGGSRFWTPVRVVMALALLTLSLHWVQKSPCRDGAWADLSQYKYFCYTDVLALYYAEHLNEGQVPYVDHAVEYPVLTGMLMGALGLPVHALNQRDPSLNPGRAFYNLNALVLGIFGVATAAMILALRRRRPRYAASWSEFFHLNRTRGIDWGTLWYIGEHLPLGGGRYGLYWFQRLNEDPEHGRLNSLYFGLFLIACAAILMLALRAPRRPRFAQLAFLVLAAFLVFGKVWSQQYVLWLLPLAVLARPRWGAFLAWQAAEVLYFCAFYGELMGASGKPIFPETVFDLAALARLITVLVLAGYVVRDIMRPEQDVVRTSYDGEDPDGGVFNDPDAGYLPLLRSWP